MLGTGWQGCQIECSELAVDWVAEIVVWVPSCSAGPWAVSLSSLCHLTDNCHRHKLQPMPSPVQPCQPSLDYILPQNHPALLEIHIYWFFSVQTVAMFDCLRVCIFELMHLSFVWCFQERTRQRTRDTRQCSVTPMVAGGPQIGGASPCPSHLLSGAQGSNEAWVCYYIPLLSA